MYKNDLLLLLASFLLVYRTSLYLRDDRSSAERPPSLFTTTAIMKNTDLFNLERQYSFYKAYHSNKINKRIHIVFVPLILITTLTLSSFLALPPPLSATDVPTLVTLLYIVYCLVLSPYLGTLFTPFLLLSYAASRALRTYAGDDAAIPLAFTLNFAGWVAQFVGHFGFEGRSPALFDSFVHSILAAPITIWLDVLFMFGLLSDVKAKLLRSKVVAKARKAVETN